MNVTLFPRQLSGEIAAISSKSSAHRLLICAALADDVTIIRCRDLNRDIEATVNCLRAMGAGITRAGGAFRVAPIRKTEKAKLDCGESGSTLRFLLPVLCALGQNADILMRGRLPDRPLEPLWSLLQSHGAQLKKSVRDVISVAGKLDATDYTLAADVSSQYISGLLFALPLLGGGTIHLTGKVESEDYITMTLDALRAFGVETKQTGDTIDVFSGHYQTPGEIVVEGDWSNAAFWLTADYLSSGTAACTGLRDDSSQGDKAIVPVLAAIRAGGAIIDASQIPDLVPILAVAAALTPGITKIVNAGRLRLKESDRLQTVTDMLTALGGIVEQEQDGLVITGQARLKGGTTDSFGDHRIAMSAAIASVGCLGPVTICNAEAVEKSYPGFFRDFKALGGCITEEAQL